TVDMKPLPMIPPQPDTPPSSQDLQTAGMLTDPARLAALRPAIVEALSKVFDPEIPVTIYELGLIYEILVDSADVVGIRMTLTAPACPAAQTLPVDVRRRVSGLPGVTGV